MTYYFFPIVPTLLIISETFLCNAAQNFLKFPLCARVHVVQPQWVEGPKKMDDPVSAWHLSILSFTRGVTSAKFNK